ncbi:hypothetical protein [Erythrobacter sp. JK5]|uniref:hypothetical protein n=1 Tax=Erythrobacter sp. JK5 TaxID=2829500 RepID=UPI001BAB90D9|nr:hypothetical protein [Erythrobacter sp. JK5]QUL39135.1 hypothetical protein KDC96_07360 [Erythrobacter sp. JK5]
MIANHPVRLRAAAMLAALSLLLTGCFISPGKFTSELQLMDQDRFAFTYEGEIFFLGLSRLAQLGAATETFEANCWDDETGEDRECTAAEVAQQRADWDAGAEERAARSKQEAEQLSMIMGGIDPSNPEASAELARLLLRQKGWDRVEVKGDGVFDVSFSVSGELSHDFMFPVIEGFPVTSPFVQLILRDGDVVRVNAPGFAAQSEDNPATGMMGGIGALAGLAAMDGGSDTGSGANPMPNLPVVEGTFTIVTNGSILANNTDEGPMATAGGQALSWEISPRTRTAPMALIDVSR